MKLYIINGPNLNMLGMREPSIYGHTAYAEVKAAIEEKCRAEKIDC